MVRFSDRVVWVIRALGSSKNVPPQGSYFSTSRDVDDGGGDGRVEASVACHGTVSNTHDRLDRRYRRANALRRREFENQKYLRCERREN